MASLQKIRNHGGLLIAIVGLAMLAFILGDLLNNSGSLLHRNQTNFGSVAGNQVSIMDFQQAQQFFSNRQEYRQENSNLMAWNSFVTYYTYKTQADKMGMTISTDEFYRVVGGEYPGPSHIVDGEWLQNKYFSLMQNCLAVNSLEAKFAIEGRQKGVSAEYVLLPYGEINGVEVSEEDLAAVYNKNKAAFRCDPYRTVEYYVVNFEPNDADFLAVAEEMAKLQEEFKNAEEVYSLLRSYDNDTAYQTVQTYTAENVPAEFKEFAFGANAEVGACSEIIRNGQAFEIARIMDINKAKKSADLAIYKRTVYASPSTESDIESECKRIVRDNNSLEEFEQAAKERGLVAQFATVYELSQNMNNIPDSRKIVTWAFGVGKDAVSQQVFICNNQSIVLAAVVETDNNGYIPMESSMAYERVAFIAQKEVKAAYIAEQMPRANSLDEVAAKFNKEIQSVGRVTLSEDMFGGDYEPAVVGAALAQNAEITPIAGNKGVYFVKSGIAFNTQEAVTEEATAAEKARLSQNMGSVLRYAHMTLERETPKSIYDLSGL